MATTGLAGGQAGRSRRRRTLYVDGSFFVGEFNCAPDDAGWATPVSIGGGDHIVFPRSAVRIVQAGKPEMVATPNHAIFYNEGQEYRRERVGVDGDHCLYLVVRRRVIAEIASTCGLPDDRRGPLPYPDGPVPPRLYLLQHALGECLRSSRKADSLLVEETLFRVVHGALTAARSHRCEAGRPRRPSTVAAQRELVEAAKAHLAERLAEPTTLTSVASAVHVSPYHLARVFRLHAGFTVHRYLLELRLRAGLLATSRHPTVVAQAHGSGFSSHSQYSRLYQGSFGVTPSTVLRAATDGDWTALVRRLSGEEFDDRSP